MENDTTVEAIVSALVAEVDKAGPKRGLRGSDAGHVARRVDPSFVPSRFGAATLKQFITKYAVQLRLIGSSGLDPIYGRNDWSDLPTEGRPERVDDAWRTWVSPANPFALFVDRQSGSVRVDFRGATPTDAETALEPMND